MPVTRTSFGLRDALVAVANMCSASRLCCANRSSTCRSTPGRQAELSTVGTAKTAQHQQRIDAGQQHNRDDDAYDPADRLQQRHVHVIQHEDLVAEHRQPVEIVLALLELKPKTDAWSVATWVSSAIVTRSRNRRVVRVATTRRSQVKSPTPRSPCMGQRTRRQHCPPRAHRPSGSATERTTRPALPAAR